MFRVFFEFCFAPRSGTTETRWIKPGRAEQFFFRSSFFVFCISALRLWEKEADYWGRENRRQHVQADPGQENDKNQFWFRCTKLCKPCRYMYTVWKCICMPAMQSKTPSTVFIPVFALWGGEYWRDFKMADWILHLGSNSIVSCLKGLPLSPKRKVTCRRVTATVGLLYAEGKKTRKLDAAFLWRSCFWSQSVCSNRDTKKEIFAFKAIQTGEKSSLLLTQGLLELV